MPNTIIIARWLAERCKMERLSLRQAGVKAGLSHTTVRDIINGSRPSPETIRKLAHGFGVSRNQSLALEDSLLLLAGYRMSPQREPSEHQLYSFQIDRERGLSKY